MLLSQQMAGNQANMAALMKAQEQLTTGKRLVRASDDPVASLQVMSTNTSLRALDQYKSTVQQASSRIATEDGALSQLSDLLTRVKQLAVSQAGDTATVSTRAVANQEVGQIFQQIIALANTRFGNEYLFGGDQSTTAPFAVTGTTGATLDFSNVTGASGQRSVQIADGQTFAATHDGKQIFADSGVLAAVRDLSRALDPASPTYGNGGIASAMTSIDSALDSVQTLIGDTGARANALDSAGQNIDSLKTNLSTLKSNLQDVDMETAMTELTSRQLAYQAALVATSKLDSFNLTDYLR
jgi:flagellar hook-associated protein 3 FlgL